jgi:hypothetical protein
MVGKDSLTSTLIKEIEKDREDFKVDSIRCEKAEMHPPFKYTMRYNGSQYAGKVFINDSVFSISMTDWLDHSTIDTEPETRNLDYYLLYPYSEILRVEYIFPESVELINCKALSTTCDNEWGTYSMQVNKSAANKIEIESQYIIKSEHIPLKGYSLLKEVNLRQKQYKDARLLIRNTGLAGRVQE